MSVLIGNNDGIRELWLTAEGEPTNDAPLKNSGILKIAGRYKTATGATYFVFAMQTILESTAPYGRLSISVPGQEVMRIYPDKLDMLNKPIKNVASPADPADAVNKSYVDPTIRWVSAFKSLLRTSSASTTADAPIDYTSFSTPLSLSITTNNNAFVLLSATGLISYDGADVIDVRIARGTDDICYNVAVCNIAGPATLGFNIACIDSVSAGSYTYALRLKAQQVIEKLKAGAVLKALIIEVPP
jgi:hypothetical protein